MTAKKNVTMCKPGCKDISVNPDAVDAMTAAGYSLADGSAPAPVADDDDGLSDAEKKMEIDAAGEVARKKGAKEGLKGKELTAAVDAAKEKAEASLADE